MRYIYGHSSPISVNEVFGIIGFRGIFVVGTYMVIAW